MGRHLAAARSRIGGRSHGAQQHLLGCDTQHQGQSAIAVVQVKPIMRGPENQASRHLHGFVSRAANLEKNAILPLQQDFPVVQAARHVHRAIGPDQVFSRWRDGEASFKASGRRHRL